MMTSEADEHGAVVERRVDEARRHPLADARAPEHPFVDPHAGGAQQRAERRGANRAPAPYHSSSEATERRGDRLRERRAGCGRVKPRKVSASPSMKPAAMPVEPSSASGGGDAADQRHDQADEERQRHAAVIAHGAAEAERDPDQRHQQRHRRQRDCDRSRRLEHEAQRRDAGAGGDHRPGEGAEQQRRHVLRPLEPQRIGDEAGGDDRHRRGQHQRHGERIDDHDAEVGDGVEADDLLGEHGDRWRG